MKVIFMGTPVFSCKTLEKIIESNEFKIVGVYTKESTKSGRGNKINNTAIYNLADKYNLKIFTPNSFKNKIDQDNFLMLNADIAVVVAYGLILPKIILNGCKYGCINLHPSLLPKYRGASPIQRAIMFGETETGVDIIKMDEGLDSGDIIYREKIAIDDQDNYSTLSNKLANIGAESILKVLRIYANNQHHLLKIIKQDQDKVIYAHKILKQESLLNFVLDDSVTNLRKIKALSGNIGCYMIYNNEKIKIIDAKIIDQKSQTFQPGAIINNQFYIQCKAGIIQPLVLQREGKKPLNLNEFLLGFKIINN